MLLLIVLIGMERVFLSTSKVKINDKTYIVPQYNLQGFEKYLLPSLDFKGTQHVYFHPNDINQLYQQQNLDPDNLECNLKYDPAQEISKPLRKMTEENKITERIEPGPSEGRS